MERVGVGAGGPPVVRVHVSAGGSYVGAALDVARNRVCIKAWSGATTIDEVVTFGSEHAGRLAGMLERAARLLRGER